MGEREDTAPYGLSKAVPKAVGLAQTVLHRRNTLNLPLRERDRQDAWLIL
jgi:hypothetical protein